VHEGKLDEVGQIVHRQEPIPVQVAPTLGLGQPSDQLVLIEEKNRPGEFMTAFEDEHGTYIMNSKDLRAIQHVERLTKLGVHSLKIEGRTKSFYYCARTAQIYRQAIDDAVAGRPFNPDLFKTLENLAHRGYTEGFLRRHAHNEYQNYDYGYSVSDSQQFVGEITGRNAEGLVEVEVKNKFTLGNSLELMTPQGNISFTLEQLQNRKGEQIDVAPGNGHIVYLPIPAEVDVNYGILLRNFDGGESTRQPHAPTAG
jgi:putative protease